MKYDMNADTELSCTGSYYVVSEYKAFDVYKAANRYEALRKLSPHQYTELYKRSLTGEKTFDSLVDELIGE